MLISEKEFIEVLKSKRRGRPLTTFAPETGVKYQFLAKVLAGDYHPGPTLAAAMGFEQVIMFKKAGRTLTDAQKKAKTDAQRRRRNASAKAAAAK